jgi:GGDEF domain-containing protein
MAGPDRRPGRRDGERNIIAAMTHDPLTGLANLVTLDRTRGPDPEALLHQADLAMYAAKRERAGRLVGYRPDLADHSEQPGHL